jgi:hypothetical protein
MCIGPCIFVINEEEEEEGGEEEEPTRCCLVFYYTYEKAQHVSGNTMPIIRSSRLNL